MILRFPLKLERAQCQLGYKVENAFAFPGGSHAFDVIFLFGEGGQRCSSVVVDPGCRRLAGNEKPAETRQRRNLTIA